MVRHPVSGPGAEYKDAAFCTGKKPVIQQTWYFRIYHNGPLHFQQIAQAPVVESIYLHVHRCLLVLHLQRITEDMFQTGGSTSLLEIQGCRHRVPVADTQGLLSEPDSLTAPGFQSS